MSHSSRIALLALLLLGANGMMIVLPHGRPVAPQRALSQLPLAINSWQGRDLPDMSAGEKRVLAADDYLLRSYQAGPQSVSLFVAFYRSQQAGDTMHSPKNCMPGAGWEPVKSSTITLKSSSGALFEANYYLIQKEGVQEDVVYWYKSNSRVFASEYWGKMYLAWDAVTKNRTDGAIIRITGVPGTNHDESMSAIRDFAKDLTALLPEFIPN